MSSESRGPSMRTHDAMRLIWGVDRPEQLARTTNISREGMFIEADEPVASGSTLRISLQLGACTMPMRGRVAWTRSAPDDHGPPGMGVALLRPPALYVHYVGELVAQAS